MLDPRFSPWAIPARETFPVKEASPTRLFPLRSRSAPSFGAGSDSRETRGSSTIRAASVFRYPYRRENSLMNFPMAWLVVSPFGVKFTGYPTV